MAEPLLVKQGTTRVVTVTGLRDTFGAVLDPTGWAVHAVARPGVWAAPVAVWRNTPSAGEHLAEVVPADPRLDPTVVTGEKWVWLHVDPAVSLTWSWSVVNLDVEVTEPGTGRKEAFTTELRLVPTTVRSA